MITINFGDGVSVDVSISTIEGKGATPAHYWFANVASAQDFVTRLYSSIDICLYDNEHVRDISLAHQFADCFGVVVMVDSLVYADSIWSMIHGLCQFARRDGNVTESDVKQWSYGY